MLIFLFSFDGGDDFEVILPYICGSYIHSYSYSPINLKVLEC